MVLVLMNPKLGLIFGLGTRVNLIMQIRNINIQTIKEDEN